MSSDPIITVEGLGKRYRLGAKGGSGERYTALRDVIADSISAPFRRLRKGRQEGNGSVVSGQSSSGQRTEEFWALKDINFEVRQGEVLGIIGRNGAGKSTLLKILSRITEPTEGRIKIKGRVASLLEVGTGFHPELTGRENIYLNGAILGMHRHEIKAKFDEIVAFAEVEKFLDTPVKRYSSGMYVRLAFAVAAHLEPEILVVDEVLAVGDAEFQKKCLGKMGEVARGGRTVLFVSHNMAAIQSLTSRCILLRQGSNFATGPTADVISKYSRPVFTSSARYRGTGKHSRIIQGFLKERNGAKTTIVKPNSNVIIALEVEVDGTPSLSLDVFLCDQSRARLGFGSTAHFSRWFFPREAGNYLFDLTFSAGYVAAGEYSLDIATAVTNLSWDHYVEDAIIFDVPEYNPGGGSWAFKQSLGYGPLALLLEISLVRPSDSETSESGIISGR